MKYTIYELKEFCEQQMDTANETGEDTLTMIGFEDEHGMWIINPFMDDTGRFEVDPIEEYGYMNTQKFLKLYNERY